MRYFLFRNLIKFVILLLFFPLCSAYKAVVINPVIDLVGDALHYHIKAAIMPQMYKQIPAYTSHKTYDICPRIHQLLFNEVVEVIEEKGYEIHIKIPQLFYITSSNNKPCTSFWTLKKNVMPLLFFENRNLSYAIPPQITCDSLHIPHTHVVTLTVPWYDAITQQYYSVGTRFVHCQEQTIPGQQAIWVFNKSLQTIQKSHIPCSYCITEIPHQQSEKIALFVTLLKQWTQFNDGIIPYVWGGCSFTRLHKEYFQEKHLRVHQQKVTIFSRSDESIIKSGFDCAGLIARAAQIAGIPYFFKNTTTASYYLNSLANSESIEAGDLLWIPGHVMVLVDLQMHTLIEARAYEHGYGKVHEIPIKQVFLGISNFHDLYKAYIEKRPLKRLDKSGNVRETFTDWKILKLSSAWPKHSS
jgi:hypothetical protein